MKKKISFRLFCAVLGRGLWQAVCWVAGIFGIKDSSSYDKAMKRIIIGCIAVIALIGAMEIGTDFVDGLSHRYRQSHAADRDCNDLHERQLGGNYAYVYHYLDRKPGYVKDNRTGETVLAEVVWLRQAQDGDSLAVFKTTGNKRGYFNRFTGQVQIAPRFDKAWIFSGGLASVMECGGVYFIDHDGNKAFDKTFPYPLKDGGYCFHGSHCAVDSNDGKTGLIDKAGNWALAPEYDYIQSYDNQYWIVEKGHLSGVVSDSLKCILPVEFTGVKVCDEGIYASKDGVRKLYDLNGNVKVDFVVQNIGHLYCPTERLDEEGERIDIESACLWYDIEYWKYGLMDKNGHPLTKAIYSSIEAITPNRFKCELSDGESIILDQYGRKVK